MMNRKIFICIILTSLLVLVASFSGCISGIKIYEYTDAEYEADENTILEVSNVNGFVNVSGWDGDTVFLNIEKFTSKRYGEDEFEKVEVNVNKIGNKISIETLYLEKRAYTRVAVNLDIKVPMYVTVDSVKTLNGGIYLSNLKGDIQIDVENGPIIVNQGDGYDSTTDTIVDNLGNDYSISTDSRGGILNIVKNERVDTATGTVGTQIPSITEAVRYRIKSVKGSGAILRPRLIPRPIEPQGEIKQVIDCIE